MLSLSCVLQEMLLAMSGVASSSKNQDPYILSYTPMKEKKCKRLTNFSCLTGGKKIYITVISYNIIFYQFTFPTSIIVKLDSLT